MYKHWMESQFFLIIRSRAIFVYSQIIQVLFLMRYSIGWAIF